MKIIRLQIENTKRIKAVDISPGDEPVVVVSGKNGAGKTCVLDSIEYAFAGKASLPPKLIRDGADKSLIRIDLGEVAVERVTTEKDSYFTVKNAEGFSASSPQELSESMYSAVAFDPLSFANMGPKDQMETLKALVGLDLSKLEAEREDVYVARRTANKEGKELKAQLRGTPEHEDVPDGPVSVSDLMAELEKREAVNQANETKREAVEALRTEALTVKSGRDQLLKQIAELEKQVEAKTTELEKITAKGRKDTEAVEKLEDTDVSEIRVQMAAADEVNEKVRANGVRKNLALELTEATDRAAKLDERVKAIDKKKADALAKAKFPIDGLAFDADGVTFNDIPFEQSSQAEKLRVSVAMALAMNPDLNVVLIRDGSLLDDGNRALLEQMAEEKDGQIWLEVVDQDEQASVIIEDGMVAKTPVGVK